MAKELSQAQCILLTVHYASSSNIKALHSFTPNRLDVLDPELVLRILLTYLPESLEPKEYTKYAEEVASRLYLDYEREEVEVDISPVKDLTPEQAQKRVKKLHLPDIKPPTFPPHAPDDLLTRFLCHRSYRIDEQTGLVNLVPQLVEPFLDRNGFLRTWYISVVLPVLRLQFEYYPGEETAQAIGLREFERLEGKEGTNFLLRRAETQSADAIGPGEVTPSELSKNKPTIARDVKGLVGPWMYGHTERKRRKLDQGRQGHDAAEPDGRQNDDEADLSRRTRKISLSGVTQEDKTGHDWEYMYRWLVLHAVSNFPLVTSCIEEWDGPGDVDFGGFDQGQGKYLEEDLQRKLELQYAQAAFASCYAAQSDTQETVKSAHGVLARLAELMDFIPPPDLATSVESLPKLERHAAKLDESQTVADLAPSTLLKPEHPLTTPRFETYMLLQMMVYTAYQFSGLGHPISLVSVAKLHFYANAEEQLAVLTRILRGLSKSGARKDDAQWTSDRAKLMWLWNWGIDNDDPNAKTGAGVLGKIDKEDFEEEMLKVFVETSCYDLAIKTYIAASGANRLPLDKVEQVVLAKAMESYDAASNGNRMRGGMKKASDIIAAFRPHFKGSARLRQANCLIAATHALSFYSLTLQHRVPFQPVSIRVSSDPVSLIDKVLEQNERSYTKLDDLIDIAVNLVLAGLPQENAITAETQESESPPDEGKRRKDAERRVTFMAIEAALREDDFETAYSYIVNRLTPSGTDITAPKDDVYVKQHARGSSQASTRSQRHEHEDDISWRAAFLAGRYRGGSNASPPTLRRLEQRTELLSLALLLAPTTALTEILAAWRRCEEETTSLQLSQQQAEEEFDDRADQRHFSSSALPGNFTVGGEQPEMILNQKRREMGRFGGGGKRETDEVPMSMFDLTRSAARAFSKNAFPLQGNSNSGTAGGQTPQAARNLRSQEDGMEGGLELSGEDGESLQQRVRRRDMVANAATGALASGLGWVLGATPVDRQQHEQQQQQHQ
ncbi:secretory pathway Sec39 [Hortaea werneckii]|nr:secretory pathway Sec39 [Hortaea werneckii]KAI6849488.1 secretory pathway Sec39 [Hortaea werneckii]KAI6941783.1 secretory pathway Sec39 [Hortaea werneckii]KAI6948410.1 secretory pathway Sec39 [Hortaea werneckii]KAI6982171.1 secretory pathway Sec39 [Hortaea werneckii]